MKIDQHPQIQDLNLQDYQQTFCLATNSNISSRSLPGAGGCNTLMHTPNRLGQIIRSHAFGQCLNRRIADNGLVEPDSR